MEIYLEDLKESKQEKVLKYLKAEKSDNFNVTPLFILEN